MPRNGSKRGTARGKHTRPILGPERPRAGISTCQDQVVTVVLDLDGVVWLADRPIPGAADAVGRLRAGGHRVVFVSNNSFSPVADVEHKLEGFGIPAAGD